MTRPLRGKRLTLALDNASGDAWLDGEVECNDDVDWIVDGDGRSRAAIANATDHVVFSACQWAEVRDRESLDDAVSGAFDVMARGWV